MISWAATRPCSSLVLHRVCEITARNDSDSMERTISFSAAGNTSTIRSMVLAAELVCKVPNTRWPVSAAVSASRMAVSYTHLRAHETDSYLVCRLLLEKKKKQKS